MKQKCDAIQPTFFSYLDIKMTKLILFLFFFYLEFFWFIYDRLGRFEHEGACEDKSFIYLWNINRRDLRPDAPHLCIETSCCIMSLAFHPLKPSLLAAGSYNGEILLYDIRWT